MDPKTQIKHGKIIQIVFGTIFVILAIIFFIQIFLKLTNHSPTELQILYISLGAIITTLIIITGKFSEFKGSMTQFAKTSEKEFKYIRIKFKNIDTHIEKNAKKIDKNSKKIDDNSKKIDEINNKLDLVLKKFKISN
ncbi:hypothetical protein HN587_03560 [Candidatus Woesearchaeota archaeon]|jgi:hypothetical protein|nr:hypothetical protein [Candidatus Woesearchaeota archaeon]